MSENIKQNTLSSLIELDIKTSLDNDNQLLNDIADLNDIVQDLGKGLATANQNAEQFNISIGDKIAKEVREMGSGKIALDPNAIHTKLQNAITKYIHESSFTLKADETVDLTPNKGFWTKLNTHIQRQMKDSLDRNATDFSKVKPFNTHVTLNYIQEKVNRELQEAIDAGIAYTSVDTKGKKVAPSIVIDSANIEKIVGGVSEKITEYLSNPENIDFTTVPKIKIDPNALNSIIKHIEDSIGDVNRFLQIDADALKQIPSVSGKLGDFEEHIKVMLTQITKVQQELMNVTETPGTINLNQLHETVKVLKEVIGTKVVGIVDGFLEEVKTLPVSTEEYVKIKTYLDQLDHLIVNSIKGKLESVVTEIIDSSGVVKADINGTEVIVESMEKLKNAMTDAVSQSLTNVNYADFGFEPLIQDVFNLLTEPLQQMVQNLTDNSVGNEATEVVNMAMREINETLTAVASTVATLQGVTYGLGNHMAQEISDVVNSSDFEGKDVNEIDLSIAINRATKKVEQEVAKVVSGWKVDTDSITGMSSENISKRMSTQVAKIQRQVISLVSKQLGEMINSEELLKATTGKAEGNKTVQSIVKSSNKFIDTVTKKITGELQEIIDNTSFSETGAISSTTLNKMIKPVNTVMENYMNTQLTALVNAINQASSQTVISTKSLSAEVRKRIANEMEMSVTQLNADFPTMEGQGDLRAIMNHSLQVIVDKFNDSAIKSTQTSIKDLQTALSNTEITPDTRVVHLLAERLNKLQADINNKVKEMLRVQFDALTTQIKNMKIYPTTVGYTPSARVQEAYNKSIQPPIGTYGSGAGAYNAVKKVSYANPVTRTPATLLRQNPGGDTRSFAGSVVNTMRYMTAGALMGAPIMALRKGIQSALDVDYDMTKAQQNFTMKDPSMREVAIKHIYDRSSTDELKALSENTQLLNDTINEVSKDLLKMSKEGAIDPILNIAGAYNQKIEDAGLAYHIASRNIDNPYEAIDFTKEVIKLRAIEEMNIEVASKGLQAMQAQWSLVTADLEKVNNMLIKTSSLSSVTAEDLIETQQIAGSVFRSNLTGMTKEEAIATSFGLSSLFTQATARSGKEGGTYYRTILNRPYQEDTRKVLQDLSQRKGFEGLNPYKEDGVTKKDYLELLGAIIETTGKIDDRSRMDLMEQLFPSRHGGSGEAIANLLVSMQEEIKRTAIIMETMGLADKSEDGEEVSVSNALKEYVTKIQSATPEEIALYSAGMKSSLEVQKEGTSAMAQIASYKVLQEFTSEYTQALTYLNGFLRLIQEHSTEVAKLIKLVTQVGLAYGAKGLWDKRQQKKADGMSGIVGVDAVNPILDDLNLEMRHYDVRRRINARDMAEVQVRLGEKQATQQKVRSRLDTAKHEYGQFMEMGASNKELSGKAKHINNLEKGYRSLSVEVANLEDEMAQLIATEKQLSTGMNSLQHDINSVSGVSTLLEHKFDTLEMALEEAGVDTLTFNKRLNELRTGFADGSLSVSKFEAEIKKMGGNIGLTEQETMRLQRKIDALNNAFARGKISADRYAESMRKIRSSSAGAVASVPGTGGGSGSTSNASLTDTMTANSTLNTGTVIATGTVASGIFGKISGLFKGAKAGAGATKAVAGAGATKAVAGAGASGGVLAGAKAGIVALGKYIPTLAKVKLAYDTVATMTDALSNTYHTDGEKMVLQAEKRKQLAQEAMAIQQSGWAMKQVRMFTSGYKGLLGSVNNMLGGNSPSIGEWFDVWNTAVAGQLTEDYAKKALKYDELETKGNIEIEKERLKQQNPFKNMDGTLNTTLAPGSTEMSLEGVRDMLGNYANDLSLVLEKNNADMAISRLDLLLRGYSEDSDEVKNVMKEYINKNIGALEGLVGELKAIVPMMADGVSKDFLLAQIAQYDTEILQNKLELKQIRDSAFENIMDKFEKAKALTEAEFSIKESDAIIGGAESDSKTVQNINHNRSRRIASQIEATQGQLYSLLSNYSKEDKMYQDIWLQIMQLEAEQKGYLASISADVKKKSEMSTFNLPSGISPMTYWEAMTSKSNYRNVSVRSGDVKIEVIIDKMTGDTKDIEKVTSEIDRVIKDAQKEMTYRLDRDVKSGMGARYFPHTR